MKISAEFLGRILRIIFILTVISTGLTTHTYAQFQEFEEIRKLENSLWLIRDEKELTERYWKLAHEYLYLDSAKAEEYSLKYLKLVEKNNDSVGIGKYYYDRTISNYYTKNYLKAIETARSCLRFMLGRDTFFALEVSQILIRSLYNLKRPEEAEREGLDILKRSASEEYPLQMAKLHYNLGLVSMYRMSDSSIHHFNEAVKFLSREPENRVFLHCYHNMSLFYRDRNLYDSALKYASKAYTLAQDSSLYNNVDYISPANNYHFLLTRNGNLDLAREVYLDLQLRQYDLKVTSIVFPEISRRIGYLQYLSYSQKIRFVILLIVVAAVLIFLGSLLVFNRKLKKKQAELTESLELNGVLIQETNHRVKNNYQIMMSMLNVHGGGDPGSINQFIDHTRARIASMARVHDMFLQNATMGTTDVRDFFTEVLGSLQTSLDLPERGITISLVTKVDRLDSDKIITLGLIINELVVNAVKYAFTESQGGQISLSLDYGNNGFTMTYRDNGSGIRLTGEQESGSGMSIIGSLARRLGGEAYWRNDQGISMEISFEA